MDYQSNSYADNSDLFCFSGNISKSENTVIEASQSPLFAKRNLSPESMVVIEAAVQKDAVARRISAKALMPETSELVGVRLNLNILKSTGVAVHSVHKATSKDGHKNGRGFYRGEVLCYLNVVVLRNAYMNVHQASREGIASGEIAKCPMASIDGEIMAPGGDVSFDGVELIFNPKTRHLFTDVDGFAVRYAEEVTILGHRGYARGKIEYYSKENAPAQVGNSPTCVRFK